MKKLRLLLTLTPWVSAAFMIGWITAGFLIIQLNSELPDAQSIKDIELKVPLRVYSADKKLISEFGNERRKPIDIENIPQSLIDAVLASEDDGFYEHNGIDLMGLFRAALSNMRTGRSGQGASTITMQVARNFFLTPEKTYTRKIKEILLSVRLEQILTKNEILSLYLNKIFLGHRAYGFGAAAEVYYGKPLHELDLAQITMLAGLPKAPSSYNPLRNPERAIKRRNYVLGRMKTLEKVGEQAYQEAISQTVTAEKHARHTDLVAPHIAEMVRAQLTEQFGEDAYWQGLNVYTTVESRQQIAADNALRAGLKAYDRRHGFRGEVGRIDLGKLQVDPKDPNLSYALALNDYPSSQEQIPAVITAIEETKAVAHTREFGAVDLELNAAKWAKRHKTANRLGNSPKTMSDILELGDVVYVEPDNSKKDKVKTSPEQEDETLDKLETTQRWKLSQIPNVSGALISIEPKTGRVISLVGGYDFYLNKYNRAIQSIRQPGSNIKPFIYSASLDHGFTPATLISGAPIVVTDEAHGTQWRPENYSGRFFGPTRMREALGKSMNLVSIRLLRAIGIPFARDYTARFGIDMSRFSPTLTMALGAGGITPIEMLSAYSALANGGFKVRPYFIESITDRNSNEIFRAPQPEFCDDCYANYLPEPELSDEDLDENPVDTVEADSVDDDSRKDEADVETRPSSYIAPRVMSRGNNFLTVSMLKDVVKRGTARRALALNRKDLAGKTGTTNDYVDAWFSGFNSKVATTVWVGFDKPATMGRGEAGSLTALPIWIDYMKTGLEGIAEDSEELPDYIEEALINKTSGKRTDEFDPDSTKEYFLVDELLPQLERANATRLDANEVLADEAPGTDIESEAQLSESLGADQENLDLLGDDELQNEKIIETSEEETEGLF